MICRVEEEEEEEEDLYVTNSDRVKAAAYLEDKALLWTASRNGHLKLWTFEEPQRKRHSKYAVR